MRATRDSIFWSATERCAEAGPAPRKVRTAGNAVRKPLYGRIRIRFRKREWEAAPPIYAAISDLDKPYGARDKESKHAHRRRVHEPHIVRATWPGTVSRPDPRRDRRGGRPVAGQHRQQPRALDTLRSLAHRGAIGGSGDDPQ